MACLALAADVDAGLLPNPVVDVRGGAAAVGAALRARLVLDRGIVDEVVFR